MSILSRLRSIVSGPTRNPTPSRKVVTDDLERLRPIDTEMANAAIAFVTGESEDDAVLLSMQAQASAVVEALDLEIGRYSHRQNDGQGFARREARRLLFAPISPFDAPLVARYVRLIAAAMPKDDEWPGTKETLHAVRVHAVETDRLSQENARKADRFVRDDPAAARANLAALVAGVGGTAGDLIDILYAYSNDYRFYGHRARMKVLQGPELIRSEAEHVQVAMKRLPAEGRGDLVATLEGALDVPAIRGAVLMALADSSKTVRETAAKVAEKIAVEEVRDHAIRNLADGPVAARDAFASLLGRLAAKGDGEAREALEVRLPDEKTARVRRVIESALGTSEALSDEAAQDDGTSYAAADGTRVEIPPIRMPQPEPTPDFTKSDVKALRDVLAESAGTGRRSHYGGMSLDPSFADRFIDYIASDELITSEEKSRGKSRGSFAGELHAVTYSAAVMRVAGQLLARLPLRRRLDLGVATRLARHANLTGHEYWSAYLTEATDVWLRSEDGDLRALERIAIDTGKREITTRGYQSETYAIARGVALRGLWRSSYYYDQTETEYADAAIWPYIAANLDIFDRGLGLAAGGDENIDRDRVLRLLTTMPKLPARYVQPVIDMAVAYKGTVRERATALLADVPDLTRHLVPMLDDGRQDYRAGAANLLATQKDHADVVRPVLRKRLAKEKSELAKAAIMTALSRLGDDLADVLSPEALLAEARAGLEKVKTDKLQWLLTDTLPTLRLVDGTPLDPEVPRWWLALADKLKQPGGNALFDLWLNLLHPEDRERLGMFILDSWIARDTNKYSSAEVERRVEEHLQGYYAKATPQQREAQGQYMRSYFRNEYLSSAAAHKGLLGLAVQVDPARLAARGKPYLKDHGKRTNQAKAVLDMLAATGEPAALQVVISTAARFKQKGVQAYAGELVEAAAERKGWTADELSDRTVPTGGFDEDGHLALPIGEDEKPYGARLADDLTVQVHAPDGKIIKSLPAGKDETTRDSKKALTAAKKEVKEIARAQGERLYEAMCAEREWTPDDWQLAFREHPVMRRLAQRIAWIADTGDGTDTIVLRPTPEGTLTNTEDEDVTLDGFTRLRVGHAALVGPDAAAAWRSHFADYEVTPLIDQFDRPLLGVPSQPAPIFKKSEALAPNGDDTVREGALVEREGWLSDNYTIGSAAEKRGWQRGSVEDGGWYMEMVKRFPAAGLVADLGFTGTGVGLGEKHGAAVTGLTFHRMRGKYHARDPLPFAAVPPILLSECRNDYRDVAAVGAFDPEWERKGSY